jgi:protoporphyrinogen oxidase
LNSRHSDAAPRIVIVGGGFTGLSAAYELGLKGLKCTVLEQDAEVGGLAGSFTVQGVALEKFYHHWFTNDVAVMGLIDELGAHDDVLVRPTRTGMYYAQNFFRLSTPLDLLRFTPLGFIDRIRLGLLALRARRIEDWQSLESISAETWLRRMCGDGVYKVVWEPLLRGKFGPYANDVSAVWFWNKLKLRGGSRGKGGAEKLAYYRGGFAALAQRLARAVATHGSAVRTSVRVSSILSQDGIVRGVRTNAGDLPADIVLVTPALPIVADMLEGHLSAPYLQSLRRVRYLANVCVVLELDRSLSQTYWLNVNDPTFPFVGIIEHTNFEPPATYGGRHIVYLSKYLPETDALYQMDDAAALEYCLPFIKRMFPNFSRDWLLAHHVWRARFSQPIVEPHYSRMIPQVRTPMRGLYLASMAQIYPEDRGTNYAIREGRSVGRLIASEAQA